MDKFSSSDGLSQVIRITKENIWIICSICKIPLLIAKQSEIDVKLWYELKNYKSTYHNNSHAKQPQCHLHSIYWYLRLSISLIRFGFIEFHKNTMKDYHASQKNTSFNKLDVSVIIVLCSFSLQECVKYTRQCIDNYRSIWYVVIKIGLCIQKIMRLLGELILSVILHIHIT